MNLAKVKQNFSLFMVRKSIKKSPKDCGDGLEIPSIEQKIDDSIKPVPKFIDPIQCFHLYGDIVFLDKINDDDVDLMSTNYFFRSIANLQYNEEFKAWTTDIVSQSYQLDSWVLVYERLMTLGDKSAFELAQTIDKMFISPKKEEPLLESQKFEPVQPYKHYLKEIENVLTINQKSLHCFVLYQLHSVEKGLELQKIGFSQNLVDLIWGGETIFVDYMLNFGMFDFIAIEKEKYFEFIKNSILSINAKNNSMLLKLITLEGVSTHVLPKPTTRICFDEKGNVQGLMVFYEYEVEETFLMRVAKAREKKTKMRKRKSKREDNLEEILNYYYKNDDFCKKKPKDLEGPEENYQNGGCQMLLIEKDHSPMKRCGFRNLDRK